MRFRCPPRTYSKADTEHIIHECLNEEKIGTHRYASEESPVKSIEFRGRRPLPDRRTARQKAEDDEGERGGRYEFEMGADVRRGLDVVCEKTSQFDALGRWESKTDIYQNMGFLCLSRDRNVPCEYELGILPHQSCEEQTTTSMSGIACLASVASFYSRRQNLKRGGVKC